MGPADSSQLHLTSLGGEKLMHELVSPPCLNSLPGKSVVLPEVRVTVQLDNCVICTVRSECGVCVSPAKVTTPVTDGLDESF